MPAPPEEARGTRDRREPRDGDAGGDKPARNRTCSEIQSRQVLPDTKNREAGPWLPGGGAGGKCREVAP